MKHHLWLSILTLIVGSTWFTSVALAQFGQNQVQEINKTPLSYIDSRITDDKVKPGQVTELRVNWNLAPEHHAYLDQFKLKALNHEEVKILEFTVSPVVDFTDVISGKIKEGTKGPGQMRASIQVPEKIYGGQKIWQLELTYQACTDEYCLFPTKVPFSTELNIDAPERAFNFSALFGGEGSQELFDKAKDIGWFFTFFIVFLAGIATSFTPCIFPMIPITLAVLGTRKPGQSKFSGFSLSFTYVMGIALTYSVLGVVAASTGALFGALLGHPVAVTFIALVFVAMALSMFGLFEIKAPAFVTNRVGQMQGQGDYFGAFVSGLVAGVVASPCVGPVLAGVLLYVATTKSLILGFFLLFTFAMGLGLIFLVMGTFTGLLQKLPTSGAWLDRIKYFFGAVMLFMAAYFVYPMVKNYVTKTTTLIDFSEHCEKDDEECRKRKSHSTDFAKPNWIEYSEEELEKAKANGRPVIFDFQAEWCQACLELEAFTFSDPQVMELGQKFTWLYFDATDTSTPQLETLRKQYQVLGLPMVIFFDAQGLQRKDLTLTGFEKAPEFLKRMQKILPAATEAN